MEKGLREFLVTWWRHPHDFSWALAHFRARGLMRVHQVFIGVFALIYGATALLSVRWADYDGGSLTARYVVLAIAGSSALLGVWWMFGPWPTEKQSVAFAIYADLAVFAVMACYHDAFTALPGLALLATNGIYIVVVHGPRALLAHVVFTIVVFAYMFGMAIAQGQFPLSIVTVRFLALFPTVTGVPILVQSYLLALRLDALDSLHDPLTRLYNRRGLHAHIDELAAGRTHLAVLAIDIDKFKAINDGHGHDAGDRVLVAVADATREAVTGAGVRSVTARTGGEEFVVVIDGGPDMVRRVAKALHLMVSRCATAVVPTISVGTATAAVEDIAAGGADAGALVRSLIEQADTAMYRAKKAGGNQTVAFDDAVAPEA